jgi:hypothetical protein
MAEIKLTNDEMLIDTVRSSFDMQEIENRRQKVLYIQQWFL